MTSGKLRVGHQLSIMDVGNFFTMQLRSFMLHYWCHHFSKIRTSLCMLSMMTVSVPIIHLSPSHSYNGVMYVNCLTCLCFVYCPYSKGYCSKSLHSKDSIETTSIWPSVESVYVTMFSDLFNH